VSEMIERVAKAIAGYMHPDRLDKYWDDWIGEEERRHYRVQARAAIEAMRDPTDAMVWETMTTPLPSIAECGGIIEQGKAAIKIQWQVMVGEALK
jgi:hypothetical protein